MKLSKSKIKAMVEKKILDTLSEGDISREKRMQWQDNERFAKDHAGEWQAPEQSAMPDEGPEGIVKQAKEIHASLMQNATATVSGDKDIALNRVLVRRDLRDLGELLDQLQAQLGSGPSELEARGHDDFSSQKEKFMAP